MTATIDTRPTRTTAAVNTGADLPTVQNRDRHNEALTLPVLSQQPHVALPDDTDRLVRHCGWIDKMVVGQSAKEILDNADDIPDEGFVAVGLTWWWTTSGVSLGRKAGLTGEQRLVPVRIEWEPDSGDGRNRSVEVVASPQQKRACQAVGMGRTAVDGSVAAHGTRLSTVLESDLYPLSRYEIINKLEGMVREGHLARWSYHSELSDFARDAVHRAHSSLCQEVSGYHGVDIFRLADPTTLEQVIDLVSLGDGKSRGQVDSMLEVVTDPAKFLRVEPVRWATLAINREAMDKLRVAVDDPRKGSVIRALAVELGTRDEKVVADVYRTRHGEGIISDDPAISRVHRALRLGTDLPPVSLDQAAGDRGEF